MNTVTAGGTLRSSIMRDYDEGEVLLAAQKLRMQLSRVDVSETALVRSHFAVAGSGAVEGLVRPLAMACTQLTMARCFILFMLFCSRSRHCVDTVYFTVELCTT